MKISAEDLEIMFLPRDHYMPCDGWVGTLERHAIERVAYFVELNIYEPSHRAANRIKWNFDTWIVVRREWNEWGEICP